MEKKPQTDIEFEKNLIASTAHITYKDSIKLDTMANRDTPKYIVEKHKYGWSILIEKNTLPILTTNKHSLGLSKLVLLASTEECTWLKLDRDGPIYKGYPTYIW